MPSLEREGLYDRIEEWVKAGGTWVVGPITDIRTVNGGHYTKSATGRLEEWTGAVLTDSVPDKDNHVVCSWQNGDPFSGYGMLQLFQVPEDAEVLASVTGGVYPSLGGKAVAFRKPFGKGQIIVLGTTPDAEGLARLLDVACRYTPVRRFRFEGNVTVAPRNGTAGEGLAVVEHRGEPASITLDEPMTDLITGNRLEGKVELKPFDVLILKK
jgi:beta-galactosidase GanA